MTEDEVFEAVKRRVEEGEYRDTLFGKPTGEGLRRLYRRGTPVYADAKAKGALAPLAPLTPSSPAEVEEAERVLGHPFPALLKRLYLEVGNGGFGPGYGVRGVKNGHHTGRPIEQGQFRTWQKEGAAFFPLCHWGRGVYSILDVVPRAGAVWGFVPNPLSVRDDTLAPQSLTFRDWLGQWLEGSLRPPRAARREVERLLI